MTDHAATQRTLSFLRKHPMGVLSTVSADGTPWGAAIYYVVDEDFTFYFVTRAETYKYQNLEQSPLAALTVVDADSQTTVQLTGKVAKLPVQQYMDIVFDKLAKLRPEDDYSWSPPVDKLHAGNYMPLCLTPCKLQYADYQRATSNAHPEPIEVIIPS